MSQHQPCIGCPVSWLYQVDTLPASAHCRCGALGVVCLLHFGFANPYSSSLCTVRLGNPFRSGLDLRLQRKVARYFQNICGCAVRWREHVHGASAELLGSHPGNVLGTWPGEGRCGGLQGNPGLSVPASRRPGTGSCNRFGRWSPTLI